MILLECGGFFRDNGLNSLPSIKHICSILNAPNIFKNVTAQNETIVSFVRKSKFFFKQKRLVQVYLDNNRPEDEVDFVQSPIVGVEMYNGNEVFDPQKFKIQKHAVVLEDHKQLGFWIEFDIFYMKLSRQFSKTVKF